MQGLATGRIQLDKGWDVVGMYDEPGVTDMAEQQSRFKNGLMNYRRYLSDGERVRNSVRDKNPFAPRGYGQADGQAPSQFPAGGAVPKTGRYPTFLNDVIGRAYERA